MATFTHENMNAVQWAVARWNAGDLDGYLDVYRPDATLHGYEGVEPGVEAIRRYYAGFLRAFPGARVTVHRPFAAADRVGFVFEVRGIQTRPYRGLQWCDREVVIQGMTIYRFARRRCVERWSHLDLSTAVASGRPVGLVRRAASSLRDA